MTIDTCDMQVLESDMYTFFFSFKELDDAAVERL